MAFVSLILLVNGCASLDARPAFEEVQIRAQDRVGHTVRWHQDTEEDALLAAEVRGMLAGKLTADQAVQIALLNNRRLQATYERLGIAQANLVQAGLLRNPIFHAEMRFLEGNPPGADPILEMAVSQNFLDVLMIPLRKRLAQAQLEAAKADVTGRIMDLTARVKIAFLIFQAAAQALELQRHILKVADASYDMARRLHRAGNITSLDLANERALYERTKLAVASAELAVLEEREKLNSLMGLWGDDTEWKAVPRLPDIPPEEIDLSGLEHRAVDRSQDLIILRERMKAMAARAGMDETELVFPELELGAAAEREPDGLWNVGPAIAVALPIFDWGQARRAAGRARLRQLWNEYTAKAVDVRSAVRSARHRILTARRQSEYYRMVLLPLAEQITLETQLQYNAMQLGVFQLLQAKQREIQVRHGYILSQRDYWIARTELTQILAGRMIRHKSLEARASFTQDMQKGGNGGH
jgi:cobalt-zinc-cadmium efflux system outer membrane protein